MSTFRIKWDRDEIKKLAEWCAKERVNDVNATLTDLLNRSQEVLSEDRRRPKLATHKNVPGFDRLVKDEIVKLVNQTPIKIEHKLEPEEILNNLSIGGLVDVLVDKLFLKFSDAYSNGHTVEKVTSITEKYNVDTGITRKKISGPVVGVVGMYMPNFRALENRLKSENVRLKFFDGEKRPYKVPSIEYVVCVPNKLPHTWQDFVRQEYGEHAYIVKGRVKEAEKVIRDIVKTGRSTLHY
jgi:hypothetical protein